MQLRTKLISPLILLLLLSGTYLHGYLVPLIQHELENEFKASELSVMEAIGAASVHLILADDLAELHQLLNKQLRLHPHWSNLQLMEITGNRLYPIEDNNTTKTTNGIALKHVITLESRKIASLYLQTDSTTAVQNKANAIAMTGNAILGGLAFIIILIAYFQHRMISRPVQQLALAAKNIQLGKFDTNVTIDSRDEVGQLAASFVKMRDSILEFQNALKNEHTRVQAVLDNIFDAVIAADSKGIILSVNPATEKMFGYEREELLGGNLSILMPESAACQHQQYIEHYTNTGQSRILGVGRETTGQRKNGQTFPVELAINEATINGERVFTGVLRDISERKNAEKALAIQHHQIATVNRAQSTYIATGDPVVFFQGLLPDVLSLSNSEYGLIGEVLRDTEDNYYLKSYAASNIAWDEDSRRLYEENASSGMEFRDLNNLFGRVILDGDVIISNSPDRDPRAKGLPKGHPKLNAFLGIPLYLGDRLVGMMGLANRPDGYNKEVIDLLQPVLNTCAHLIDAVGKERERQKAADELVQAKEDAEAADKAKSQFLATMSHELRTPLNGVLGMLHLLHGSELSEQQKRYIETATGSGELLLSVINDILDFSKMEANKLVLESIPFEPANVVEETAALLAKLAHDKKLELICSIGRDIPTRLKGDPTRLRQILTNLLNNAIKFTETGHVAVYADSNDKCIWFGVVDTGIGMSTEQQKSLFKPFSQVDSSHTRKYGGSGLGLVICQRLVNAMGGELRVSSTPGLGSDFRFELSLEVLHKSPKSFDEKPQWKSRKILLVDDNKPNRIVLRQMLNNFGIIHITEADCAQSALKLISDDNTAPEFDIIIIDFDMPDCNGLELAGTISRRSEHMPCRQIILGTADAVASTNDTNNWIAKPVRQSDLYNTLQSLLGTRSLTQENRRQISDNLNDYWFDGCKILLVDDNSVNQEVAKEILKQAGLSVDIRENGEQAVTAVQNNAYDLLLMDIQMPVMDGLEATRRIRQLGGRYAELPIIAMTAHALAGDADKSLNAGMNAHVTKPIDAKLLFQTISKWLQVRSRPKAPPRQDSTQHKTSTAHLPPKLAGIDVQDLTSRLGEDHSVIIKFLVNFKNSQGECHHLLQQQITKGDWDKAAHLAHTLKGSSGNIGAKTIYKLASEMEQLCRSHKLTAVQQLLPQLQHSLQMVINSIADLEAETGTTNGEEQSFTLAPESVFNTLDQLVEFLAKDLNIAQKHLQELSRKLANTDWSKQVNSIEQAFNQFDIDCATNLCKELQHTYSTTLVTAKTVHEDET